MNEKKISIEKKCILGVNTKIRSVQLLDDERLLYACGDNVLIWNKQTKNQTFLFQCSGGEELVSLESISCRKQIAVSTKKNGHFYILIFDALSLKRSKKIIKLHSDDGSAVISLSFSGDGKQCLVLHDAPHYHLILWSIEKSTKIMATVRLATPSGKLIRRATMKTSSNSKDILVCVSGDGIVRFFKVADSIFRPITVNLCREQQNYIVQCWLSHDEVILGTDRNELIVMRNFIETDVVPLTWSQSITALVPFSHGVVVGGSQGSVCLCNCLDEHSNTLTLSKTMSLDKEETEILAIDTAETEDVILCLLSNGRIATCPLSDNNIPIGEDIVPWFHKVGKDGSTVKCIDTCILKPIVATAGSDRSLRVWNFDTNNFELMTKFDHEIVSLSLHPSSLQILICFEQYAEVSYIYNGSLSTVWRLDVETNGCSCFSHGGQYFALVSGVYVQVYCSYKLDLICTLRGHSAPIKSLSWRKDDQEIATIGSDNVICMWGISNGKRKLRYVNEGHSYRGGCFDDNFTMALVNTDAHIDIFDVSNSSFQTDTKFPTHSIAQCWNDGRVAGTFIDSSLRGDVWIRSKTNAGTMQQYQKTLHSGSITCLHLHGSLLFTASQDSTFCISELSNSATKTTLDNFSTRFDHFLVPEKDLADNDARIKQLRLEIDTLKHSQDLEIQEMTYKHGEMVSKLNDQINLASEAVLKQKQTNELEMTKINDNLSSMLTSKEEQFQEEVKKLLLKHEREKNIERARFEQIRIAHMDQLKALEDEKEQLTKKYNDEEETLVHEMEQEINHEIKKYNKFLKEKQDLVSKHEEIIQAMEEDANEEINSESNTFRIATQQERKIATRLQGENDIAKKKYDVLMKDFEEHKETIISLEEKHVELSRTATLLKETQINREKELKQLDLEITKEDIEISNATVNTHEMEKLKMEQNKRIRDIREMLQTRDTEMREIQSRTNDLDAELKTASQYNDNLRVQVEKVEGQLHSINKEVAKKSRLIHVKMEELVKIEQKVQNLTSYKDNINELKRQIVVLYQEIGGDKQQPKDSSTQKQLKDRKSDLLEQKIARNRDIIENNKKLHQSRVRKLKQDRIILEAQLLELKNEANNITKQQEVLLN